MKCSLFQKSYDFEIEAYDRQLEEVYKLCWACECRVNRVIHRQNTTLMSKIQESSPMPAAQYDRQETGSDLSPSGGHLMQQSGSDLNLSAMSAASSNCSVSIVP